VLFSRRDHLQKITCWLMACKNIGSFVHIFVEVLFLIFISYPNKERRRMFICGVSVTPKVSQVLGELTTRIEMESAECK
jgi:hypothetical protein